MCPQPPGDSHDAAERDDRSPDEDRDGQVSETAAMTPGAGDDGVPGTDDGVPPAEDSGTQPGGAPPKSYGD